MAAKIDVNFKKLKRFLPKIKKQFNKKAPSILVESIKADLESGVSPVKGYGRFKPYSKSYKQQIDGKVRFFTNSNGKIVALKAKTRGRGRFRFFDSKFTGKKKSPVNMKLSGDMIKSLKAKKGFLKGSIKVSISDKKADYHNRRGAGKSKVVRRLLPSNPGEKFNRRITLNIEDLLIDIVNNAIR